MGRDGTTPRGGRGGNNTNGGAAGGRGGRGAKKQHFDPHPLEAGSEQGRDEQGDDAADDKATVEDLGIKWKTNAELTDNLLSELHGNQELKRAIIPDGELRKVEDNDNSKDESFFKLAQILFKANPEYRDLAERIIQAEKNGEIGELANLIKERWRQLVDMTEEVASNDVKGIRSEKDIKGNKGEVRRKLESIKAVCPWYFKIRSLLPKEWGKKAKLIGTTTTQAAAAVSTGEEEAGNQDVPHSKIPNDGSDPAVVTTSFNTTPSAPVDVSVATLVDNLKAEATEAITSHPPTPYELSPPTNVAGDALSAPLDSGKNTTQEQQGGGEPKLIDTQSATDGTGASTARAPIPVPMTTTVSSLAGEVAPPDLRQVHAHVSQSVEDSKEQQGRTGRTMALAPGRSTDRSPSAASDHRAQEEAQSRKTDQLAVMSALQAESSGPVSIPIALTEVATATSDGSASGGQDQPPEVRSYDRGEQAGKAIDDSSDLFNGWGDDAELTEKLIYQLSNDQELLQAIILDGDLGEVDDSNDTLYFKLAKDLFKASTKYKALEMQISLAEASGHTGEIANLIKKRWRQLVDMTKTVNKVAEGIKSEKDIKGLKSAGAERKLESMVATHPWYFQMRELLSRKPSKPAKSTKAVPVGDTAAVSTSAQPIEHQEISPADIPNDESELVVIDGPSNYTQSTPNGAALMATIENLANRATDTTPYLQAPHQPNSYVKAADDKSSMQPNKNNDASQKGTSGEETDTQSLINNTGARAEQAPPHIPIDAPIPPFTGQVVLQATEQARNPVALNVDDGRKHQGHSSRSITPTSVRSTNHPRSTANLVQAEAESLTPVRPDELTAASAVRAEALKPKEPTTTSVSQAQSPSPIILNSPPTVSASRAESPTPIKCGAPGTGVDEAPAHVVPSAATIADDEMTTVNAREAISPAPVVPNNPTITSSPRAKSSTPIMSDEPTTRPEQGVGILPSDATPSATKSGSMATTVDNLKAGTMDAIYPRSRTPRQINSSGIEDDELDAQPDQGIDTIQEGEGEEEGDSEHKDTDSQRVMSDTVNRVEGIIAPISTAALVSPLVGEGVRQATLEAPGPTAKDAQERQGRSSGPMTSRGSTASAQQVRELAKSPILVNSDRRTASGNVRATSPAPVILKEPAIITVGGVDPPTPIISVEPIAQSTKGVKSSLTAAPGITPIFPRAKSHEISQSNKPTTASADLDKSSTTIASYSEIPRQIDSSVKATEDELGMQSDKGENTIQKGTSGDKQEDADTQTVTDGTSTPTTQVLVPVPVPTPPLIGGVVLQAIPEAQDTTASGVDDERGRQGRSSPPEILAFRRPTPSAHRVQGAAESPVPTRSDNLNAASARWAKSPGPVVLHESVRTNARVNPAIPVIPDEPAMRLEQVFPPRPNPPAPKDTNIIKDKAPEITTTTLVDHLSTMSPTDVGALGPDSWKQLPLYSVEDRIIPTGPSGSGNQNPEHTSNSVPEGKHRDEKHIFSAPRTSDAPSTPQIHPDINVASERDVTSPEKVKSGKTPILKRTGEANRAVSPGHVPALERVTPVPSVKSPKPHPTETIRKPAVKGNARNIGNGSPGSHVSKAPSETGLFSAMKHIVSAASAAATPVVSDSLATKAGQVGTSGSRNVSSESQVTVRATDQQPGPEVPHVVHQNEDNFSKTPRSSVQLQASQSQRAPAPIPAPSPSYTTPAFPAGPSPESSKAAPSHFQTMKPPLSTPGNATFPTVDTQDQPKAPMSQMAPLPVSVARLRGVSYATPTFPPGPPPPEPSSVITSRPQTVKPLFSRLGSVTSPTAEIQPQLPVRSPTSQRPEEVKHAARIPTPECVVPVLSVGIQQNPPVIQPTMNDSTRDNSIKNVNLASSRPSEAPSRLDLTSEAKRTASVASVAVTPVISESLATGGKQAGVSRPKNLSGESQAAVKAKDRQQEQKQEPEPEIPIVYQEKDFFRKTPQSPVRVLAPRSQMTAPLTMPVSGPKSSSVVIPAFRPGPPGSTIPSRLRTVEPPLSTPGSGALRVAETQSQPPVITSERPNHYARTVPASTTAAAGSIPTPIITNMDDRSHLSSNSKKREPSTVQPLTSNSERSQPYSESQSMALGGGTYMETKLDDQSKDERQRHRTSAEQQLQQSSNSMMMDATVAQQQGNYRPFVPVPGSSYTQPISTPMAFDFGDRMDSRSGMGSRRPDGGRGSALTASVSPAQRQVGAVPSPSRSNSFRSESTVRQIRPTPEGRYDRDRRERERERGREREREQEEERYGLMRRRRRDDDRRIATTRVRHTSPTRLDDRSRSTTRRRYVSPARSDVECNCSSCQNAWIWKSLEYCGIVVAFTLYLVFMAKLLFQDQGVRMIRF
ncbi:hypothetical protein FRB94_003324 [Tulasnella sp. JGI-2019a]|nr:hypothetical protein FRB94_003324 [Tulasnella sp. JGI-2019a]